MSRKILLLVFALLVVVPLNAQVYPLKRKPKTEKKAPKKTDYEKLITKKAVSDKGLFTAQLIRWRTNITTKFQILF